MATVSANTPALEISNLWRAIALPLGCALMAGTAMLRTPGSQLSRSSPKQRRPAEVEGLLEWMEQGI